MSGLDFYVDSVWERAYGWMDDCLKDGWVDGWLGRWTVAWIDGWVDGWVDGCVVGWVRFRQIGYR